MSFLFFTAFYFWKIIYYTNALKYKHTIVVKSTNTRTAEKTLVEMYNNSIKIEVNFLFYVQIINFIKL